MKKAEKIICPSAITGKVVPHDDEDQIPLSYTIDNHRESEKRRKRRGEKD